MWRRWVVAIHPKSFMLGEKYFNYETCTSTRETQKKHCRSHPKDRREFCSFLILMKLLTINFQLLRASTVRIMKEKISSWKFSIVHTQIFDFFVKKSCKHLSTSDMIYQSWVSNERWCGEGEWIDERMNEKWIDGWTYLAHSSCNDWTNPILNLNKLKRHTMSEREKSRKIYIKKIFIHSCCWMLKRVSGMQQRRLQLQSSEWVEVELILCRLWRNNWIHIRHATVRYRYMVLNKTTWLSYP